ncbi:transcription elongation factor GreA [Rickettsiales endosymbiont of Peranema trichophorum]|uniref:transcription elongation factor GreA n=1 Tax=Rickettsiales endosymbiont of Peranema trichophorum TaxID=2486577 RepID=UPI001023AB9D|nr:transcription elongation factor GreA [Rickettsiales endosymbiont of Peranema trichophorum]RZI45157.1 transcription elongation factor GreA [Rickettsiales endosymbiont of Peranema trichophorum]
MDKFPITIAGYEKLCEELHRMKFVERPSVVAAIAEARAHGDLSENAEYSAAKEKQGFIEAKISDLEDKFARAEVIDTRTLTGQSVVFGATVRLVDEDTEKEVVYKIVSDYEAEPTSGCISFSSPIAKAMIGKKSGDSVEVVSPRGIRYYQILDVKFV